MKIVKIRAPIESDAWAVELSDSVVRTDAWCIANLGRRCATRGDDNIPVLTEDYPWDMKLEPILIHDEYQLTIYFLHDSHAVEYALSCM